jgi:hypothetical protein
MLASGAVSGLPQAARSALIGKLPSEELTQRGFAILVETVEGRTLVLTFDKFQAVLKADGWTAEEMEAWGRTGVRPERVEQELAERYAANGRRWQAARRLRESWDAAPRRLGVRRTDGRSRRNSGVTRSTRRARPSARRRCSSSLASPGRSRKPDDDPDEHDRVGAAPRGGAA